MNESELSKEAVINQAEQLVRENQQTPGEHAVQIALDQLGVPLANSDSQNLTPEQKADQHTAITKHLTNTFPSVPPLTEREPESDIVINDASAQTPQNSNPIDTTQNEDPEAELAVEKANHIINQSPESRVVEKNEKLEQQLHQAEEDMVNDAQEGKAYIHKLLHLIDLGRQIMELHLSTDRNNSHILKEVKLYSKLLETKDKHELIELCRDLAQQHLIKAWEPIKDNNREASVWRLQLVQMYTTMALECLNMPGENPLQRVSK